MDAARVRKLRAKLAEVKRLVSESDADPTFIGEFRMEMWKLEQELAVLAQPEEGRDG